MACSLIQAPVQTMDIIDPETPAKDYFIAAILVTIFCFWPLGIVAIVKALKVNQFKYLSHVYLTGGKEGGQRT